MRSLAGKNVEVKTNPIKGRNKSFIFSIIRLLISAAVLGKVNQKTQALAENLKGLVNVLLLMSSTNETGFVRGGW